MTVGKNNVPLSAVVLKEKKVHVTDLKPDCARKEVLDVRELAVEDPVGVGA